MIARLIVTAFVLWFVLSCLVMLPRVGEVIRAFDMFYLLPEFRFFAPTPGQQDFHILYRDTLGDGSVTDWTEVEPLQNRRLWHVIWNERKRGNKARLDLTIALSKHIVNSDGDIRLSIPYLMVLNHVSGMRRAVSAESTQFLLMQSTGTHQEHEHTMLFSSELHQV